MTYREDDLRRMARAIGAQPADLARYRQQLEVAAIWYRLDRRAPTRIPPSKLRQKLDIIARRARRLLKALGIDDPASTEDGPFDLVLLEALASTEGSDESAVLNATRRVGRLVEIIETVQGAIELEKMAANAAQDVVAVHRQVVPPGHQGEAAVNNWIAEMLPIYRSITGREPGTSVGAPAGKSEGKAGGPLIRCLTAAGAPLNIRYSPDAWRERVRLILRQSASPE